MNERTKQFRVGVVVFATIVISSLLVLWNSDFKSLPFQGDYQLTMLVDQAPGVAPGTPVRRHGLLIGRVESVEDTPEGALITLSINKGKEIHTNEIARIRSSLVGDAVIEIVKSGPGNFSSRSVPVVDPTTHAGELAVRLVQAQAPNAPSVVPPGGRIQGIYVPSPLDSFGDIQADLKQTINSLGAAGEEVAELADRINTVLGENDMQRITRLVESMDRAMSEFATVTKNLNDIVGDEEFKTQLKEGLTQLPSLVADARAIMEALEGAVGSADENLKNLQGLTGPLGDRGTEIVATLEKSVRNLEELLGQVALLTRNLNNSEGTIGLLLRERDLYDRLNETISQASITVQGVQSILADREIRIRIRQILDNVNVFAQKIAADPARVVRGVVDRETPLR
jgi:phospholipid/cholesterol/gamma-HCH transport system substrate-binding protein